MQLLLARISGTICLVAVRGQMENSCTVQRGSKTKFVETVI